jgi:hypothetical protein
MRLFRHKREVIIGKLRKLYAEKLHSFFFERNNVHANKFRRINLMEGMRNTYQVLIENMKRSHLGDLGIDGTTIL